MVVEADPYGGDLAIRLRISDGAALPEVADGADGGDGGPDQQLARVGGPVRPRDQRVSSRWCRATWWPSKSPEFRTGSRCGGACRFDHTSGGRRRTAARCVTIVAGGCSGGRRRAGGSGGHRLGDSAAGAAEPARAGVGRLSRFCRRGCSRCWCRRTATGQPTWPICSRILAETVAGPLIVGDGFVALDPAAVRRLEDGEDPTGGWPGPPCCVRLERWSEPPRRPRRPHCGCALVDAVPGGT